MLCLTPSVLTPKSYITKRSVSFSKITYGVRGVRETLNNSMSNTAFAGGGGGLLKIPNVAKVLNLKGKASWAVWAPSANRTHNYNANNN